MSFLGLSVKSGNIVFGYNRVKDNIYKKKVSIIIIAFDLSLRSRNDIISIAEEKNIEFLEISYTMDEIYKSAGKYSGILGVTNEQIALRIKSFMIEESLGGNI